VGYSLSDGLIQLATYQSIMCGGAVKTLMFGWLNIDQRRRFDRSEIYPLFGLTVGDFQCAHWVSINREDLVVSNI
jgi:hypothetical protein